MPTHKTYCSTAVADDTKMSNHWHRNIKLAQTGFQQDGVECNRRQGNIELFREFYSGIREDCHGSVA